MNINIDNYELFVMDYLEGTLDTMEAQEMSTFLLLHPDIAMEIDDLENAKLTLEPELKLETDFIASLKKNEIIEVENINEENYAQFFISNLENDINDKDSQNLKTFLKINPNLVSEFHQQQNTKLIPDENITFLHKESLKKKDRKVFVLWPKTASVAALLLLSFWIFKPNELKREVYTIEEIEPKKLSSLFVDREEINLAAYKTLFVDELIDESIFVNSDITRYATLPKRVIPLQKQIPLPDEQWKNEMLLMQSFVFNRDQLSPQIDYAFFTDEKTSAFRLISSVLWKTTKGQIKNISDEIIQDDLKIWQAGKLQALTNNYISVKPRTTQ